jgi:hypothetical protein
MHHSYFPVQCPQVLPESAGEELKIKVIKNKNIIFETEKIFPRGGIKNKSNKK